MCKYIHQMCLKSAIANWPSKFLQKKWSTSSSIPVFQPFSGMKPCFMIPQIYQVAVCQNLVPL
jgi:hypothetical protein